MNKIRNSCFISNYKYHIPNLLLADLIKKDYINSIKVSDSIFNIISAICSNKDSSLFLKNLSIQENFLLVELFNNNNGYEKLFDCEININEDQAVCKYQICSDKISSKDIRNYHCIFLDEIYKSVYQN